MERLVLRVYEDHAGVRVVRVVTIVHTRDWQVGTVLQTTGQEGTSRHGTVPLHGRHREGDPLVVEVGGEVVDVDGVWGGVAVAHGGEGDGDTAGHEGSRVGGENVTVVLRLAVGVEALEDRRHSVSELHLRGACPGGPPDLALSPRQGQAGGLHDVVEGLPLSGRHVLVITEVQELELTRLRGHGEGGPGHGWLVRTTTSWRIVGSFSCLDHLKVILINS